MLVLNLPFKALMFLTLMRPSLVLFLVLWLKLVKDFLKVRCRLALLPFLISCLIWLDLVASLPLIKERILVIILLLHFLSLIENEKTVTQFCRKLAAERPLKDIRDEYNYPKKKGIKDECSRLLEASTMKSRRGFAIQRLMNAMRQAHADGWFIVFDTLTLAEDRKSGSAGMPRPISYAVFCLKKKKIRKCSSIYE